MRFHDDLKLFIKINMSLYKQAETTLYFKKIADKEDGQDPNSEKNPPRIKQSRAARIMSLKNDLVCIKDVANYYDVHMAQKRSGSLTKSIYGMSPNANEKDNQLIKTAFKQLY
jgi:hypothetical protein